MARAIDYYKKVFGATELFRMNGPDGKVGHAELKIGIRPSCWPTRIQHPPGTPVPRRSADPVSLYVYLPDVDSVVKRASAEGGKILKPVENQFYRDRQDLFSIFGHLWGVATHVEDVSPKDMEERMKKMRPAA